MSKPAAFRRGRSLGAKISGGKARPPANTVIPVESQLIALQLCRHILLSDSANCTVLRAVVLTQYRRATDGRTDGIVVASTAFTKRRAVKMVQHTQDYYNRQMTWPIKYRGYRHCRFPSKLGIGYSRPILFFSF